MMNRGQGYPAPPMGGGQMNRPPGPGAPMGGPMTGPMGGPQPRKIDPNQMPNPVSYDTIDTIMIQLFNRN
jgi:hypothetical protein